MPQIQQNRMNIVKGKHNTVRTVGSSSSNKSGSINSARARAIRILHPPEKAFVAFCCISGEKLRP